MRLIGAVRTDPGLVRRENQDSYGFHTDLGLYLVADGMGGRAAGKRASEEATRTIVEVVRDAAAEPSAAARLRRAIEEANRHLWTLAERDPELRGMGTTVASLLVDDGVAHIAHVGDSRVYRLRGGAMQPLTRDHSYLAELRERGIEPPEPKERQLYGNLLSRAVGLEATVEVDVATESLAPGDVYLLCSDGVYKVVEIDDLATVVAAAGDDVELGCRTIVERANAAGGPDNSTIILVRVLAGDDPSAPGSGG